ncbi:MAG: hypothetical protein H0X73_09865 [Chthoniobacterales bacterium]|nr:hypothetical protein [Chthoniobacterales bacterium]
MQPLTVIDAQIEFSTRDLANVRSHLSPFELQTLRTRFRSESLAWLVPYAEIQHVGIRFATSVGEGPAST